MPLTREQQAEIKILAQEMVKQICMNDDFINKIANKVSINIQNSIDVKLGQFESKLDEVKKGIEIMDHKYAEEITNLSEHVDELHKKVHDFRRESPNIAQIVSEVNDIRRRENNILIFGISDDVSNEFNYVLDICKIVIPNVNVGDIKVNRLGRSQPNKSRPIKVHFPDVNNVSLMLRNKKKLANYDVYKDVNIRADLTPNQREYHCQVWNDLKARQNNGEQDIFVGYINGVPVIRKKNQSSGV